MEHFMKESTNLWIITIGCDWPKFFIMKKQSQWLFFKLASIMWKYIVTHHIYLEKLYKKSGLMCTNIHDFSGFAINVNKLIDKYFSLHWSITMKVLIIALVLLVCTSMYTEAKKG